MSISSLPSSVMKPASMYDVDPRMFAAKLDPDVVYGLKDVATELLKARDDFLAKKEATVLILDEMLAAIKEDRCSIEEQLADIKTDRETLSVRFNELNEYCLINDDNDKNLKFREEELAESIKAFDTQKKLFMHQHHIFMKQKRLSNKVLMNQAMKKKQQLGQKHVILTRSRAKRINYSIKLAC